MKIPTNGTRDDHGGSVGRNDTAPFCLLWACLDKRAIDISGGGIMMGSEGGCI